MRLKCFILFAGSISVISAYTIDVVNITKCSVSKDELGTLNTDLESEETIDQIFNGEINLPTDLDESAIIAYDSRAWKDGEWQFLFKGQRSLCNSIVDTLTYKKFRKYILPEFPETCNVPAGDYTIDKFPISGQYVVLSDIRNAAPLVKHEVKLIVNDDLILCRKVVTKTQT